MNGGRQPQQDTKALRCIVALLFSLAVIADIASCLPVPVRRAVLVILWRAERVAHSYVYWTARDCGLSLSWGIPGECRDSFDPDAAMLLAGWFRVLAIVLRDLPRRALAVDKAPSRWRAGFGQIVRPAALALVPAQAPDTS